MYALRAVVLVPALGWLALAASLAQTPQEPVLRVTANRVQVDAVVTGRQGRHVTDLRAEDFQVFQDGKPQKITQCTYIRTGPEVHRTVAVIVDDLGLSFESVVQIRRALKSFIDEQLQPGDRVAIIRTSGDVGALQQFTSDKRKLHAAAERLRWHVRSRTGICSFQPERPCHLLSVFGVEPEAGRLSALETLERIISVVKGLAQLPGRKSILLFSEYIALASDSEVVEYAPLVERAHQRVLDAATRASAAVYSIDPRGLPVLGNTLRRGSIGSVADVFRGSQVGMGRLAEATGGEFLRDIDDLSIPVRMAMKDQQGYYLLAYPPGASTFDAENGQPKFHKIDVRVKRSGLTVRSHKGFEGVEDQRKTSPPPGSMGALTTALMSPFAGGDIEVGITSIFSNTADQGSFFTALVSVMPGGLTVRREGDGRVVEGDIVRMVVGEDGAEADQTAIAFSTKLSKADYERALKDGLSYRLQEPVKKSGPYEVRVAVRDNATGRIGTASQFVEIPDLQPERVALSGITLQAPGIEGSASQNLRGSAPRIFRQGETVTYRYQILNPKLDKGTRRPTIEAQIRLFRDGKEIRVGKVVSVEAGNDPTRLAAGGDLKIGPDMPPGNYVLQVVVADLLSNVFGADFPRSLSEIRNALRRINGLQRYCLGAASVSC